MSGSGTERVVRAKVTSYLHPDGSFRMALRGQSVLVATSDLQRFDDAEAVIPLRASNPRVVLSDEPPRGGRYATVAAWTGYAEGIGVPVADGAKVKEIIAAVDASRESSDG